MTFDVCLNDLRFYAFHGVFDEERQIGNEFRVSLSVTLPFNEKMETDDIDSTVSYADLFDLVSYEMNRTSKTLEKVALSIAHRIQIQYPQVTEGNIRIEKVRPPIPHMLGTASVTLRF